MTFLLKWDSSFFFEFWYGTKMVITNYEKDALEIGEKNIDVNQHESPFKVIV